MGHGLVMERERSGLSFSGLSFCRWMGAAASAVGRGHLERGLPCQDASGASLDGCVATVVVSDGAGSARHSEHGAAGAVETATQVLRETASWTDLDDVRERLLAACREKIDERADKLGCSAAELGATLAFVAVTKDACIAGNLGDGVVVGFFEDKAEVLIKPVRGEFANETVFLTSNQASRHFRIVKKHFGAYDGFAIMTDGAAESLYLRRNGSIAPALVRILSLFREYASDDVRDAIQSSAMPLLTSRTRDDCSLAVLRHILVTADTLREKSTAFQMELLGTRNTLGLANRLKVLDSFLQCVDTRAVAEAIGLSERTVRRHQRALESLSCTIRR